MRSYLTKKIECSMYDITEYRLYIDFEMYHSQTYKYNRSLYLQSLMYLVVFTFLLSFSLRLIIYCRPCLLTTQ